MHPDCYHLERGGILEKNIAIVSITMLAILRITERKSDLDRGKRGKKTDRERQREETDPLPFSVDGFDDPQEEKSLLAQGREGRKI